VAFARLTWIASRCEPIVRGTWFDAAQEISATLGLRRTVVLLQSAHPSLLVTWGIVRPKIVLPSGARDWPEERVRIVLSHELSHVRRADWILQLLGGLLRAVYWFNPLVWVACHRLRHESEHACDDDVLNLGVTGSEYATQLLDVARALHSRAWFPAPGMARPSSLRRRVTAMLNTNLNRNPVSVPVRIAIAAAALTIAIAIAGSGLAAQVVSSPLSGSFVDAVGGAIPDVTIKLTNTQTGDTYAIRGDSYGHFAFGELPAGRYRAEASALGFSPALSFFSVEAGKTPTQAVIPLPLATVEETIVVTGESVSEKVVVAADPARLQAFRARAPQTLLPPIKVRDVHPQFPQNRLGTDATVFLEGILDTNGFMKGLQVLQPVDADFAAAATSAVNQWQFEPTRLHGVAVDTAIRITVRFQH